MARVHVVAAGLALSAFGLMALPATAADPGPGCVEMDDGWWYCAVHVSRGEICIIYQESRFNPENNMCVFPVRT